MMKQIVLLLCLSIMSGYLHAQQRPVVKKDKVITRSPKKITTVSGQKLINTAVKYNSLLVVENRIFDNDAEAFAWLPKDSLQLINTIRDSLSTSNIKSIRIYKRK